ncbi:hypothetical protein D641_0104430 [Brachybacterium muris UCD-AY4]|uniref:Uncharacterized protein n=1 Tax=Brachybacterium muris UCD-AY4 TaxID=1249481 RepID=A0A022KZ94_9MICO|nr:hypothetical protein D641_0104430 [Brachybacterium muris UCD-AY4]
MSDETRDGAHLAFFLDVTDFSELDPQTWEEAAGIRAPQQFDATAWHDDNLVITYTIAKDPNRDAWQVYSFRVERACTDEHRTPPPVTGADAARVRPDALLEDALAYFERVMAVDRLALLTAQDVRKPAPRSRSALSRRRQPASTELATVAQVYNAHIDDKPAEAVQDALGVSRSTADRRIREARSAGLITAAASRGRKPKK